MSEKMGVCAIVPNEQEGFRPRIFGMGILVGDRVVVTCAHVVSFALDLSPEVSPGEAAVRVCFPFADGAPCVDGTVDPLRWFPPGRRNDGKPSDVAVIMLGKDAPGSAERAQRRKHESNIRGESVWISWQEIDKDPHGRGQEGQDCSVWENHPDGEWAEGKIMGPQPGGRAQFDGLRQTGAGVEPGFSGGGIYDRGRDAILGMIVESDKERARKIAQFIDMASLEQALEGVSGLVPAAPLGEAAARSRVVPPERIDQTQAKLREIEGYLRQIGDSITPPEPGMRPLSLSGEPPWRRHPRCRVPASGLWIPHGSPASASGSTGSSSRHPPRSRRWQNRWWRLSSSGSITSSGATRRPWSSTSGPPGRPGSWTPSGP